MSNYLTFTYEEYNSNNNLLYQYQYPNTPIHQYPIPTTPIPNTNPLLSPYAFNPSSPFPVQLDPCAIDLHALPLSRYPIPPATILTRTPPEPGPYPLIGSRNQLSLAIKYYEVALVSGATILSNHPLGPLMNINRELKWLRRSLYECFSVHLHRAG